MRLLNQMETSPFDPQTADGKAGKTPSQETEAL